MKVRFFRSAHNVSERDIVAAVQHIGLHNATIELNSGPNGTLFWIVEADSEKEVLMEVSAAEEVSVG